MGRPLTSPPNQRKTGGGGTNIDFGGKAKSGLGGKAKSGFGGVAKSDCGGKAKSDLGGSDAVALRRSARSLHRCLC